MNGCKDLIFDGVQLLPVVSEHVTGVLLVICPQLDQFHSNKEELARVGYVHCCLHLVTS